ncbi:MAG: type III pantothenate kinase [Proteobacteria bacterium]|nr:type III pantothenate kinase [Pseudomonadota bacterium]
MLLVIDVGNTNTVIGVYARKELRCHWRVATNRQMTVDENGILLSSLITRARLPISQLKDAIVACVVPPIHPVLDETLKKYFGMRVWFVGPGMKTGIPILMDNPPEVGADRIANAVGAYQQIRKKLIVVDFGTATTFDCVSDKGEYLGGIIAPGLQISAEALFQSASKLPRVELEKPRTVIGKNTIESMQSGIIFGYTDMVDGIVRRIKTTLGADTRVIATGGLAPLVAEESSQIDAVDEYLTLSGLRIIYELNYGRKKLNQ